MRVLLSAVVLGCVSGVCFSPVARAEESVVSFGRFGTVHVYARSAEPRHVVLFLSGDGGWNQGVVDMARELAGLDALVAGIDITHYLRQLAAAGETCVYPAADFEVLSQYLQKSRGDAVYRKPVLVGYSSGATLVYAALVQAPATTFKGALSLGFCPDLPLSKPLCKGSGLEWDAGPKGKGVVFHPAGALEAPWIVLQGTIDQVCDPASTESFVRKVANAGIVMLPRVGHGFSVPRNWLPQFRAAFARIVAMHDATEPPPASVASLADLPLTEVESAAAAPGERDAFALHVTGDGGYGVTDKGLCQGLAAHGIPTVVLNSLHYFWKARTPDGTAADMARVVRHYLQAWKKNDVILVGYSWGADVLPFVVTRLPEDLRARVHLLALLGPTSTAGFEFHFGDWFSNRARAGELPVLPEIEKLRGMRIVCFYGADDSESIGPRLPAGLARVVVVSGGHRFGTHYEGVVETILQESAAPR